MSYPIYDRPSNPSPALATVFAWVDACSAWDADAIGATLSDNEYEHVVLPASMNMPPSTSKAAWLAGFTGFVQPAFDKWEYIKVHDVVEAPGGIVISHMTSKATSKTGVAFNNEYFIQFTVRAESDGVHRIVKVKEMMDSLSQAKFFHKAQLGFGPSLALDA